MREKNNGLIAGGLPYAKNQGKPPCMVEITIVAANNLLILFQTPNMAAGQILTIRTLLPDLSVGRKLLKTFQSPNSGLAHKVIRVNLSSDSQKKKDSGRAVLIQVQSLEQVTNYPDYIGLVQYCQSSAGGWDLMSVRNTYGVQRHRLVNDIHLVLLCNSPWTTLRSNFISSLALIPIFSIRERVSSADINGSLPVSLVCLRAISLRIAATMNPALLSLGCLTFSILFITSCGTLTVVNCDFAFLFGVAIFETPIYKSVSVYSKKEIQKGLTCVSLINNMKYTRLLTVIQTATPRSARDTFEASNHNVIRGNTMAMYKSTQTHPEFIGQSLIVGDIYPTIIPLPSIHDKNRLPLLVDIGYSHHAPYKTGVGFRSLKELAATHDAPSVFFCVYAFAYLHRLNTVLYRSESMVALVGQPSGWLDPVNSSTANPVNVITPIEFRSSGGDSLTKLTEIATMATIPTQTQFKFLFLSIKRSDTTAKPCRITVTALNEHDARMLLVRDYVLSFAGRVPLPVQHSGRA